MSDMLNLTGLWNGKTKEGKWYASGTIGNVKVLLFKNEKKQEGSKQPDFNLCLAPKEDRTQESSARPAQSQQSPWSPPGPPEGQPPF